MPRTIARSWERRATATRDLQDLVEKGVLTRTGELWYIRYWLKLVREAQGGLRVDHATLNRWVVKYSPLAAAQEQSKKRSAQKSWRMDETYMQVRGKWMYLYRAVDKAGDTLDFMLYEPRNGTAVTGFFARALSSNGIPDKIVIDKSGPMGQVSERWTES